MTTLNQFAEQMRADLEQATRITETQDARFEAIKARFAQINQEMEAIKADEVCTCSPWTNCMDELCIFCERKMAARYAEIDEKDLAQIYEEMNAA